DNITTITVIEENIFLPPYRYNLSVYVLDVDGQSAIILKGSKSLLIDSGVESDAETILKRLRNIGVMNLDFAIVSNTNEENLGGMPYIIIQTSPAIIYETGIPSSSSNYILMQELINASINKSTKVDSDKLFSFDNAFVKLMVIYDDGGGFSSDDNDNSIVTKLTFKENKFLFMSNCGFNCLERLSKEDINSDVIVIDGSCDSTTLTFLQKVTPEIAIATGEICEETKNRFRFLNVPLYTSKEHGDIKIESDGRNFNLKYLKVRVEE
ncbi:MAG: hypothetical protein QQN41_13070, partial [Nitrosopumilus sp.]